MAAPDIWCKLFHIIKWNIINYCFSFCREMQLYRDSNEIQFIVLNFGRNGNKSVNRNLYVLSVIREHVTNRLLLSGISRVTPENTCTNQENRPLQVSS